MSASPADIEIEALSNLFDRLCFRGQATEERALDIIEQRTGIRFDPNSLYLRRKNAKEKEPEKNDYNTIAIDDFILKRCQDTMDKIPFGLMGIKPMALSMVKRMFCRAFSYLELYLPRLPEFVAQNDVCDAYLLYLACAYVESVTTEKEFPRHVANEVAAELGSELPKGETGDEMAIRVSHDHLFEEFVEKVEEKKSNPNERVDILRHQAKSQPLFVRETHL